MFFLWQLHRSPYVKVTQLLSKTKMIIFNYVALRREKHDGCNINTNNVLYTPNIL